MVSTADTPTAHRPGTRRLLLTCVACTLLAFTAGFGYFHLWASGADGGMVVAAGSSMFPDDTVADWAMMADHVVRVHLVSETAQAPSPDDVAAGEGMILRDLTLAVDDVLWSRPGAHPLPDTLSWDAAGWVFHGDQRTEMNLQGAPRITAGHSYLVAVMNLPASQELNESGWQPVSERAVVPFDDGTIGAGSAVIGGPPDTWIYAEQGKSAAHSLALLNAAAAVQPNLDDNPFHRLAQWRKDHDSATNYG